VVVFLSSILGVRLAGRLPDVELHPHIQGSNASCYF
jgi:hypothetical protein